MGAGMSAMYDAVARDPHRRFRTDDEQATDEEVISRGTYRMSSEQSAVYFSFVEMMSGFDPHDMMLILEDALKDSQASGMLDQYGGLPDDYGGIETL